METNQSTGGVQQDVPNATATLVLGICSLVFCGLGPILGTIALVLAGKGKKEYDANPSMYKEGSLKNLKAGKVCGLIGLIGGGLVWLFYGTVIIAALTGGM